MKIITPLVEKDIDNGNPLKIEFGGGPKKKLGYYNIDIHELDGVDIVADLNKPLHLIPDNSVQFLYASHVLEHIDNLLSLIEEIYRISMPNAEIEIVVPHHSNPFYYSDPTHLHPFGLYSMCYFVDEKDQPFVRKTPAYYASAQFLLREVALEFFDDTRLGRKFAWRFNRFFNKNPDRQEFFERYISRWLAARQVRFKLSAKK